MPKVIEVPVFAVYDDQRGVVHMTKSKRDAELWSGGHGEVIPAVLTLDLEKKA